MTALANHSDRILVGRSVLQAGSRLDLSKKLTAAAIGTSTSTLYRVDKGAPLPSGKPYENALLLIRIYKNLAALLGADQTSMRYWMTTQNQHLDQQRPIEMVQTTEGLVRLSCYLDRMVAQH
jgi:uncharacterized protein (DUF2384 family)